MGTCADAKASIGQVDVVEMRQEGGGIYPANVEVGRGILVPRKSAGGQANGNGPAVRHRVLGMQPNSAGQSGQKPQPAESVWTAQSRQNAEQHSSLQSRRESSTKNSGENWRLSGPQVTMLLPGGSGIQIVRRKVLAPQLRSTLNYRKSAIVAAVVPRPRITYDPR